MKSATVKVVLMEIAGFPLTLKKGV